MPIGVERVNRKSGHQTSVVYTNSRVSLTQGVANSADIGQPSRAREGSKGDGSESVNRTSPQVLAAIGTLDILAKLEPAPVRASRLMGKTHQNAREQEPDETGILGLTERPPFQIVHLLENALEIERAFELGEAVKPEERGMDPAEKRCEGRGGDTRDLGEGLEIVVRMIGAGPKMNGIVAQKDSKRLASRVAELRIVDLPEKLALIELQGACLVLDQFGPGKIQNTNLDGIVIRQLPDQVGESPP